jgi:hypothetical protein
METLKDILWPVVVVGGLGAFIDVMIGKAGQAKAKDFLLEWWVRFDDVRWRNFGREEGLFASEQIEKWFGPKIWSLRRITAFIVLFLVILSLEYFSQDNPACRYCHDRIYYSAIALFMSFLGFSISVSFTKLLTSRIAYLCGIGYFRNMIIFLIMLIVNLLIYIIWGSITQIIRESY